MMLMSTLPGVQDLNQNDSRGWGTGSPTLMGGQSGQKLLVLDGAASQDSGNRDFGYIAPSVDAIAEVRVLVANFNAEYGARSGGQMNVMVKSGSTNFHGSGYYFIRNDAFNANEFFNNKTGVPRPATSITTSAAPSADRSSSRGPTSTSHTIDSSGSSATTISARRT